MRKGFLCLGLSLLLLGGAIAWAEADLPSLSPQICSLKNLEVWVDLHPVGPHGRIFSPGLSEDLAGLLLSADLKLKRQTVKALSSFEEVEKTEGLFRCWIIGNRPRLVIRAGKVEFEGTPFRVEVEGIGDGLTEERLEEELTRVVNESDAFSDLRLLYKAMWTEWLRRKGYFVRPVELTARGEGDRPLRSLLDSYLESVFFSEGAVGGIILRCDGADVEVRLSEWEEAILTTPPKKLLTNYGIVHHSEGLLKALEMVRGWIRAGYGQGILNSQEALRHLIHNLYLLDLEVFASSEPSCDLTVFAREILSLLSSPEKEIYGNAPHLLSLTYLAWLRLHPNSSLGDYFRKLSTAGYIPKVSEKILRMLDRIKARERHLYLMGEIFSSLAGGSILNRGWTSKEPITIQLQGGGVALSSAPYLLILALGALEGDTLASLTEADPSFPTELELSGSNWMAKINEVEDMASLIPGFSVGGAEVQGRTVVFKGYRIKFLKAGAGYEDLILDALRAKWLRENAQRLGIIQEVPAPLERNGSFLFRIDLEKHPRLYALLEKGEADAKRWDPEFAFSREGVFVVYPNAEDFSRYLQEAKDDEEFFIASIKNIDTLMKLARARIVVPAVATMFHNLLRREEGYNWSQSLRRFLAEGRWQSLWSAGRMDAWRFWMQNPNLRVGGFWDFQELQTVAVPEDWAEYTGRVLFVWFHLYAMYLLDHHPEYFRDPDRYAPKVARSLKRIFSYAYQVLNPRAEALDAVMDYIDFELMARQMLVFCSGEYGEAVRSGDGLPYPAEASITPADREEMDEEMRGWGTISSREIDKVAKELGIDSKELLGNVILGSDLRGEYFIPMDVDERIEEMDWPEELKKRAKRIFGEYKMKWNAAGERGKEDLGPVNGPYPITELIKALYAFTAMSLLEKRDLAGSEEVFKGRDTEFLVGISRLADLGIRIPDRYWPLLEGEELPEGFWRKVISYVRRHRIEEEFLDLMDAGDGFSWMYLLLPAVYYLGKDLSPPTNSLGSISRYRDDSPPEKVSSLSRVLGEIPWDRVAFQGRNLTLKLGDRWYRIKFALDGGVEELRQEGAVITFLRENAEILGIRQEIPHLVRNFKGGILFSLAGDSPDLEKVRAGIKRSNPALQLDESAEGIPFLVYEVESPDLFIYPEDLEEGNFWGALGLCVDTLRRLYPLGLYYRSLVNAFHNRELGRRYELFVEPERFIRGSREVGPAIRFGVGRLTNWRRAFARGNFRKGGMADFGEIEELPGSWESYAKRSGEVFFALMNLYILWLDKHHPGWWKDPEEVALGLERVLRTAYEGLGGRNYEDWVRKRIDWTSLGRQVSLFCSRLYVDWLSGKLEVKDEELFPGVAIYRFDAPRLLYYARGVGYIHEDVLKTLLRRQGLSLDLVPILLEAFEYSEELPDVYKFTPDTVNRIKKALEERLVYLSPDRIEAFLKDLRSFEFRWNLEGREDTDDLGPLNGPFPGVELINAVHIASLQLARSRIELLRTLKSEFEERIRTRLSQGMDEGIASLLAPRGVAGRRSVGGVVRDLAKAKGLEEEMGNFLGLYRLPPTAEKVLSDPWVLKRLSETRNRKERHLKFITWLRANGALPEEEEAETALVSFLVEGLLSESGPSALEEIFEFEDEVEAWLEENGEKQEGHGGIDIGF